MAFDGYDPEKENELQMLLDEDLESSTFEPEWDDVVAWPA